MKLRSLFRRPNLEYGLTLLLLVAANTVAFASYSSPALYSDDWTEIIAGPLTIARDKAPLPIRSLTDPRPFQITANQILINLVGPNLSVLYAILWVLNLLSPLVFYSLLRRLRVKGLRTPAVIWALLFSVYPTVYTHMWLTTAVNHVANMLLVLVSVYFLLRYVESGWSVTLFLSVIAAVLSFGVYENQLGLLLAWPLLLTAIYKPLPPARRVLLWLPSAFIIVWLGLRVLAQNNTAIPDPNLPKVNLSFLTVASRLFTGYRVSLIWGWTGALVRLLPVVPNTKISLVLLVAVTTLIWLVARMLLPSKKKWSFRRRLSIACSLSAQAIAGLLLLGAGYIPAVFVYGATLSSVFTRYNYFAVIGSTIVLSSALTAGSLLLAKSPYQVRSLYLASVIPFLAISVATQASVQRDIKSSWHEQVAIWQSLFNTAPNFVDGTTVIFVLPDYADRVGFINWKRTPLSSSWETGAALQLLYNNPTIKGGVTFPDIDTPEEVILTTQGVLDQFTGNTTAYTQTVLFRFDPNTRTLTRMEAVPAWLVEGAKADIPLPSGLVTNTQPKDTSFRYLVAP